jgi:hypothetical protein
MLRADEFTREELHKALAALFSTCFYISSSGRPRYRFDPDEANTMPDDAAAAVDTVNRMLGGRKS